MRRTARTDKSLDMTLEAGVSTGGALATQLARVAATTAAAKQPLNTLIFKEKRFRNPIKASSPGVGR